MEKLLLSRIGDLLRAAQRGDTAASPFLTPEEAVRCDEYLKRNEPEAAYRLWGGYDDAERKRLFLLSAYSVFPEEDFREAYGEKIRALRIEGSGYASLNHRSFLGALLALGIERDTLGDIIVEQERSAILLCDSAIADFLLTSPFQLSAVGRDKVKVSAMTLPEGYAPERPTQKMSDTVSSPRLDAVVAALCGLSREKAKALVCGGGVRVNYLEKDDPSAALCEGDLLSVSGFGRFRIEGVSERTRKDRIRLTASKYL